MVETGRVSSLLGFGRDLGSCPAPPFRTDPADLAWPEGCPDFAPCCSEYGYCQTRETWELGTIFRDCNGESNGLDLPLRSVIVILTGAVSLYSLLFTEHYKRSWRRGTLGTRVLMMNFLELKVGWTS